VRYVSCGACACTPSIRSQLRAGGGKLSFATLAVLALAPHSTVGAPALHTRAPHSVVLADEGAPAVLVFAPLAVVLGESVLFIGTRFSNLHTAVDTPAEASWCCA
jgi:hypothetical protein